MRKIVLLLMIVPVICAFVALSGGGMFFREGVALSCIAILCVAYRSVPAKEIALFIAALLFSIAGDVVLPVHFIFGIVLYFVAHLGFLWFSLKNGKMNLPVLLLVSTAYLLLYFLLLHAGIEGLALRVAVFSYVLVSCVSLAAAAGVRFPLFSKWLFVAGVASLLFSDTLIALRSFTGHGWAGFLIMPTYYLSHILMTAALVAQAGPGKSHKNENDLKDISI